MNHSYHTVLSVFSGGDRPVTNQLQLAIARYLEACFPECKSHELLLSDKPPSLLARILGTAGSLLRTSCLRHFPASFRLRVRVRSSINTLSSLNVPPRTAGSADVSYPAAALSEILTMARSGNVCFARGVVNMAWELFVLHARS